MIIIYTKEDLCQRLQRCKILKNVNILYYILMTINSIKELIQIINFKIKKNINVIELFNEFDNYNSNDWEVYKNKFDQTDGYQKIVIFKDDVFELILIKWSKGATTKIHSHPKNGCLLKHLQGKLLEEKYLDNILYKKTVITDNITSYMHDKMGQHKIIAEEDSYSLHFYSPPNFYNMV